MTAIRIGRLATVVVLCAGWLAAAFLLWRTSVPGSVHTGGLDVHRFFSARELTRATRYQRVVDLLWLLGLVAEVVALVVLARRARRLVRSIGLGPIGAGVIVAMLMLVTLWFVSLPFGLVGQWWAARHGLAPHDYVSWIFAPWGSLLFDALFVLAAVATVMGLARKLGDRWWLVGAPVFIAFALAFAFLGGYVARIGTQRLDDPSLRKAVAQLERTEGVRGTPVRVLDVGSYTTQANAYTTGFGPSANVVVWNTLLDGRFSAPEIRVVIAHELGHVARRHILKAVGWSALLALPLAWLVTLAARRRGGLGNPASLPVALLALVLLGFVAAPAENAVSRRYEAEADWAALRATHDAAATTKLFQDFQRTSLQEPSPSLLDYLWLENHPTLAQRIAMAQEFRRRSAGPRAGS